MLSYLVDVNDKMDAFRGLRNQRLAMDQATVLSSTDLDGLITYVNDRFCDLSGHAREDLIGKKYSLLRSESHNKSFFTNLWETVSSGKIWAGEICNTNSKGQLYWTQTTIIPSLTEAGNIFEYQSIAFEITSTKNAEKQLMLQRTIAEKATEAKTHFLANMSHELRTPMNGLMGMASLLETTELTSQQSKFVSGILSSADHQLPILNNILDLSKMQSGHMTLENIEFDLSDLLSNIVTLFTPNATDKNISMGFIIHNNLNNIFIGDKSRIKQLITNFVSNSVKFTDKGKVVVSLSESSICDGVRIDVEDTGLGISPESQSKLFKKFTQVDETITRRFGGTGLGLSICKYISKGLGGEISVSSIEHVGSTFSVDIPLKRSDAHVIWPSIGDDVDVLLVGNDKKELSIYEDILTEESVGFKSTNSFNNYSKKKLSSYDVIVIVNEDDNEIDSNLFSIMSDPDLILKAVFVISIQANPSLMDENGIRFISKPITSLSLLSSINDSLMNKAMVSIVKEKPTPSFKIKPGLRFLIVDDNASNREILDLIIVSFSGKSDLANDGAEAITMIEKNSYDLIFMDCHMPNMDGYQTIEVIRKMGIHTPIIMVTADIDKDVSEKANSSGANGLILKPISILEIKNAISEHCLSSGRISAPTTIKTVSNEYVNIDSLNMMMDLDKETCKSIVTQIVSDYDSFKSDSNQYLDSEDYDSLLSGIHKFKGGALSFASESLIMNFSKLDDYLRHEKNIDLDHLRLLFNPSMLMSDQYIKYLNSL
jgi:polar amino acid transport system substrate-binding protein